MWELDHKEDWVPKNWYLWIVVLEKTLESPVDWMEIKLVNLKGNQPCIFIGRNGAEAEAPILWPPDVSVQLNIESCPTLCNPMDCTMPGCPVHHQHLELAQIHIHRVSDAIQPSHPLSSPSPPAFNLSQHRVISSESVLCIRWPKFWSFNFSIPEYSGLISFRMDWLDLLVAQGTLKSLLQYHSSTASILWCSAFFMVQLWHLYITNAKTIALTRRTFFFSVMSLLFNVWCLELTYWKRSWCWDRLKAKEEEGSRRWES